MTCSSHKSNFINVQINARTLQTVWTHTRLYCCRTQHAAGGSNRRTQRLMYYGWAAETLLESEPVTQITSGRVSSIRISLTDFLRSENTINTYNYNTIYWSSIRSYYNLDSHITYTKDVSKQKITFQEINQSLQKRFLSTIRTFSLS
jgi:hypothetical protein